jgi:HAD superfamily hydrolase (TIGR01509 family)
MASKIKVVVIDLGGVYFTSGTPALVDAVSQDSSITAPQQRIDEVLRCSPGKEGLAYRQGKITRDEFWAIAEKELGISKEKWETLEKIWFEAYQPQQGMPELVKKLKEHYKLIVFSGNIAPRVEYIDKKYHLHADFIDWVYSFDAGCSKGDIHFYEYLMKKLKKHGFEPEDAVYIDDHQKFLDKAKPFGINTILFQSAEQLEADLRALGLEF